MPLKTRKKQLAMKAEGTEGVAETLTAGDVVFEVEDLEGQYTPEMQERRPLRSSLSAVPNVVGKEFGPITGRTELKPAALATDPLPLERLLLSLGLQAHDAVTIELAGAPTGTFTAGEYITGDGTGEGLFLRLDGTTLMYARLSAFAASEGITGSISGATATVDAAGSETVVGKAYRPDSGDGSSFTSGALMDGLKWEAFGARGDGSFEVGGTGQIGYVSFTVNGPMLAPVDQALFSGVTIPKVKPSTFKGSTVTADGVALCIDSFSLSLNNTVAQRACSDAATGVKSYRITDRRPTLSIDPEVELEATIDFQSKLAGAALFGFYAQIGADTEKRVIFAASQAQYTELGNADRESLATYAASLLLTGGGHPDGDDEFVIAFVP